MLPITVASNAKILLPFFDAEEEREEDLSLIIHSSSERLQTAKFAAALKFAPSKSQNSSVFSSSSPSISSFVMVLHPSDT